MATIPAPGHISNNARTQGEVKTDLEEVIASLRQVPGSAQAELTATIASGSITPAGSGGVVVVETEAASASDDLTNIVATNYPDGACLLIRNSNAARFVVVKHAAGGAGQIQLDRSADYVLDDTKKWLLLQRRGADWFEVLRGPARPAMPTVAKSATFTVQKEDLGKVFLCTGTFAINLLAAVGAGNGFVVTIRNVSTGTLTLDANASELIDGSVTMTLAPLSSVTLTCDGTAWLSTGQASPSSSSGTINPIINGAMEVWQRGTTVAAISQDTFLADRWSFAWFGTGLITMNRSTSVPTVAQAGVLFNYSLELDVTTADATIAAGEFYLLEHKIEGYNWRPFAQRQFTLSFWVLSSKTGVHCVRFANSIVDRSYVSEYTVNVANTWEFKTVTVSASPSAGGWNSINGIGLRIGFALASGTTFQTTAGAWQTGDFVATSGQVNVLDNVANFFRVTGVKMELGAVATPIQYVPFQDELARCQRYYQKSFPYDIAPVQNSGVTAGIVSQHAQIAGSATQLGVNIPFQIRMRATPTITTYNPSAANAQARNATLSLDGTSTSAVVSEAHMYLNWLPHNSSLVNNLHHVHWSASAEL